VGGAIAGFINIQQFFGTPREAFVVSLVTGHAVVLKKLKNEGQVVFSVL